MLESKHVIGLFLLMLVFSGVFFALGYVMGRNQYDGQVRAEAINPRARPQQAVAAKPDSSAKHANSTLPDAEPPSDLTAQPSSEWSFYNAGKPSATDESLKPSAVAATPRTVSAAAKSRKASNATPAASNSYILQVAALRKASDALALSSHLQKKNFPAFVAPPGPDKYYRVQVGPYSDQKSADAARKGLEGAGFKAIVKH